MWLSNEIEEDAQTRSALRKLHRLAKEYRDATELPEESKFISTEIRLFRPKVLSFTLLAVGFGLAGYFRGPTVEASEAREWLEVMLRVVVPIFVLAVTITSLARSFSESMKFASEYFNESCRMELYCCLALLTTIVTLEARFIADMRGIPVAVNEGFAGVCLGATLWCITGIAFIIRETIRCAQSGEAVKAATNYAAKKLSYGLVANHYSTLWMARYSEIMNQWCQQDFKAIQPPSQYYSAFWKRAEGLEDDSKEISLGFKIDICKGAVDYNFEALRELDNVLQNNQANLFLHPHAFQKDDAKLGIIQCRQAIAVDGLIAKVERIAKKGCRFHGDRIQERSEGFWSEHFNKLENALSRAIRDNDVGQMHSYLGSLVRAIESVEKAREDEVVRKANDRLEKCWDLIDLYRRSLRQILLDGRELKHQDKAICFAQLLRRSLDKQVEQVLRNGDWRTLKLVTWIVPTMWAQYETCRVRRGSALWEKRARFGSFYAWANSLIEEHCSALNEEAQTKMRLTLHEGTTRWLLIANKKEDTELVSSLCSAAKKIAFARGGICFERRELSCQHLILLGKMISRYLNDEGVTYDDVKNLVSEPPLEKEPEIDFEELASFYLNSRLPIETHEEYFHLFMDSVQERRADPLSGIGAGQSWTTGLGGYEMALSFVYLGSFALRSVGEPKVRPIDYRSSDLKEAIEKLKNKKIGAEADFARLHGGLKKIEEWVDECSKFHQQQEAQKIAQSRITEQVWQSYDKGFQEGLKEGVPFVDYCARQGYVKESDTASMKPKWHMPKELFLGRSSDDIVKEGRRHGGEIGHDANTWTVRSLIDFSDGDADIGKDVGMRLIKDKKARVEAAKEVKKAVEWLKSTSCSTEQGMIVVRGLSPDVLHLLEEDDYRPAWREEQMERGFAGYYHDYRILHLQDVRGRPLCAAIDLRGWRGLSVSPEFVKKNQAGRIIGIRELEEQEIEKTTKDGTDKVQAKGYCVVELELFWKMPEEKPKQKIFLYPLPPDEPVTKGGSSSNSDGIPKSEAKE
jgi:hypothetical protein